jgi:hypothetical protein
MLPKKAVNIEKVLRLSGFVSCSSDKTEKNYPTVTISQTKLLLWFEKSATFGLI